MTILRNLPFAVLLFLPFLAELVAGSHARLSRFHGADWTLFLGLSLGSVAFWASCISLILENRKARPLGLPMAMVLGLLLGGHRLFYTQFASVVTPGFLEAAIQHGFDVKRTLSGQLPSILLWLAVPSILALLLLAFARVPAPLARTRRRWRLGAIAAGLVLCPFLPENTAKPLDAQLHQSLTQAIYRRAMRQNEPSFSQAPYLPPLHSNRLSILLILSESLRHDSYCSDANAPCLVSPHVNRVMHDRVTLSNFRSNASWTIMSTAVVTTGLPVTTRQDEYQNYPNLFEVARASGRHTEYLGSHQLKHLHLRSSKIDKVVGFSDLSSDDSYEYADEDLSALAAERLAQISQSPYLVMLQFGDTHSPYAVDSKLAPFVPYARDFSWEGTPRLFNQYRNAIHRQDQLIGRMLEKLRNAGHLDNTLVLFTSDHGEAFREHTTLYHGGSVLEEEIHVPAWIWAPPALRREQGLSWDTLASRHDTPASHADVVPTLLDFMQVLDEPVLRNYLDAMPGRSLLRSLEARTVPIGNCSDLLACTFPKFWTAARQYEARGTRVGRLLELLGYCVVSSR